MTIFNSVRIIFYNSNIESGLQSNQAESMGECTRCCEKAFRRGASFVHARAINNLRKLVPEVLIYDIVLMTMWLSDPARLKQIAGKTIVVLDPAADQVESFLSAWSPPQGTSTQVIFSKASYNESFEVQVSEVLLCADECVDK